PRLAPPMTPFNPAQVEVMKLVAENLLNLGKRGAAGSGWRSAEAARVAAATPIEKGADGKPLSHGKLAIYRVGGFNVAPSAAFIFRMARYSEKTVISYNPNDPRKLDTLRPVTEVDGVPVPPDLRGKIFAIGAPGEPSLHTYEQFSDNFVEHLAA